MQRALTQDFDLECSYLPQLANCFTAIYTIVYLGMK